MSWRKIIILWFFWFLLLITAWVYVFVSATDKHSADILWWPENNKDNLNGDDFSNDNVDLDIDYNDVILSWEDVKKTVDEWILNIHMPRMFYNNWFEMIKRSLESRNDFIVNYILYDDLTEYKIKLSSNLSDVDIFMLPSMWFDSFSEDMYKFDFSNPSLKSLFHHVFYETISNSDYSIIPHSIDPAITLINKSSFWNDIFRLDLNTIKRYILMNWKKSWTNVLNFWLSMNDIWAINRNISVNYNYSDLTTMFFSLLINSSDLSFFDFIIDISNDEVYKWWDPISFYRESQRNWCSKNSSLCMLLKWNIDISFWFISDLDIIKNNINKSSEDLLVFNTPFHVTWFYPVNLWWFAINKDTSNEIPSFEFVDYYIELWSSWSRHFRSNVLSAFNIIYNEQIWNLIYDKFRNQQWFFKPIYSSLDNLEFYINDTNLIKVLEWKHSKNLFLNEIKLLKN